MTVRLLRPSNGQNPNTLYTGWDESILLRNGGADTQLQLASDYTPTVSAKEIAAVGLTSADLVSGGVMASALAAQGVGLIQQKARRILTTQAAAQPTAVMASPITPTQGTANAVSTINGRAVSNPSVLGNSALLTFFNGVSHFVTSNSTYTCYNGLPLGLNTTGMWGHRFNYDGQRFEISIRDVASTRFRVRINGQWASASDYTLTTSTALNFYYVLFDLGAPGNNLIEVFHNAPNAIYGYNFEAFRSISPAIITTPTMLFFGDSYTALTGVTNIYDGYAIKAAEYLGISNPTLTGVGGQGYLANGNNGSQNALDRIADLTNYGTFDLNVVPLGINDTSQNAAALQAQVTTWWQQAMALVPNGIFACVGPWRAPVRNPAQSISDAVKNGFLAGADLTRSFFVDTYAENWQNGATYNGTGTQDGNAYAYIGPDGTHPNTLGHAYLGRSRLGPDIVTGLKALAA